MQITPFAFVRFKQMSPVAAEIVRERIREMIPFFIFQKVAGEEQTGTRESVAAYGAFTRALAGKFIAERQEAKILTQEIFIALWRLAERSAAPPSTTEILSALIARQRLFKYLRESRHPNLCLT